MIHVYTDSQIVIGYDEVNHCVKSITVDGGKLEEIYSPDGKDVSFDDLTDEDIITISNAFTILAKIGTGITSDENGKIIINLDYPEDVAAEAF